MLNQSALNLHCIEITEQIIYLIFSINRYGFKIVAQNVGNTNLNTTSLCLHQWEGNIHLLQSTMEFLMENRIQEAQWVRIRSLIIFLDYKKSLYGQPGGTWGWLGVKRWQLCLQDTSHSANCHRQTAVGHWISLCVKCCRMVISVPRW